MVLGVRCYVYIFKLTASELSINREVNGRNCEERASRGVYDY